MNGAWQRDGGRWFHRPWWKVAVNTVLRALQTRRRPARLFVVFTRIDDTETSERPGNVVGYGFGKVLHS